MSSSTGWLINVNIVDSYSCVNDVDDFRQACFLEQLGCRRLRFTDSQRRRLAAKAKRLWARIYRKQVNAQIAIEISARYAAMFQTLAVQLLQIEADQPLPERREEFTSCALQFAPRGFRILPARAAISDE